PFLGIKFGVVTFAVPMVLLAFASVRAGAAARRDPAARAVWVWIALTTGLAAVSSLLAVAGTVVDTGLAPFYLGAIASVALAAGMGVFARRALRGVAFERVVDAALLLTVLASIGLWFVGLPGFGH